MAAAKKKPPALLEEVPLAIEAPTATARGTVSLAVKTAEPDQVVRVDLVEVIAEADPARQRARTGRDDRGQALPTGSQRAYTRTVDHVEIGCSDAVLRGFSGWRGGFALLRTDGDGEGELRFTSRPGVSLIATLTLVGPVPASRLVEVKL